MNRNLFRIFVGLSALVISSLACSSEINEFTSVAFSPDGMYVAAGANDGTTRIWEAKTGTLIYTLRGHTQDVSDIAYSPNGKILASGSTDQTAIFWDTVTGKKLYTFKPEPIVRPIPGTDLERVSDVIFHAIAFSPDGKLFAAATHADTIHLWDANSKELVKILMPPSYDKEHESTPYGVEFSSDGKYIISYAWAGITGPFFWRTDNFELQLLGSGNNIEIQAIATSPINGHLAISVLGKNNEIEVWDLPNNEIVTKWEANSYKTASRALSYSPDGTLIALGDYDKMFTLWDAKSGNPIPLDVQLPEKIAESKTANSIIPTAVSISPDNSLVAISANYGIVGVWDTQTGKLLWQFSK